MDSDSDRRGLSAERTRVIFSDPVRVMIVALLTDTSMSASELAKKLDISADRVRANLRRLLAAGVISTAREERRRGVVQRYFLSEEFIWLDDDEYAALTVAQRKAGDSATLRLSLKDAVRSFLGRSQVRPDSVITRTGLILDEAGWEEFIAIHREALDKVLALKARMADQAPEGGAATIPAVSVLLGFEEA